jgi:hypothetical protein
MGVSVARRTVRLGPLPLVAEYPAKPAAIAKASVSGKPEIQVSPNPDGSGTLSVEPPGAWEWKNCALDLTHCTSVGTGTQISTAGAGEGTLFTATLEGRTLISPRWDGNVYFAQPPSLRGTIRANEFIFPWNGD